MQLERARGSAHLAPLAPCMGTAPTAKPVAATHSGDSGAAPIAKRAAGTLPGDPWTSGRALLPPLPFSSPAPPPASNLLLSPLPPLPSAPSGRGPANNQPLAGSLPGDTWAEGDTGPISQNPAAGSIPGHSPWARGAQPPSAPRKGTVYPTAKPVAGSLPGDLPGTGTDPTAKPVAGPSPAPSQQLILVPHRCEREVYIERLVPTPQAQAIYVDRPVPVPVDRLIPVHVPVPIYIPVPVYPPPRDNPTQIINHMWLWNNNPQARPSESLGMQGGQLVQESGTRENRDRVERGTEPLRITWHPYSMERDRRPQLTGKRRAEDSEEEDSQRDAPRASQLSSQCPTQRLRQLSEWPQEWRAEYEAFKSNPDEAARRRQWDTWPPRLQNAVLAITSIKGRPLLKKWRADSAAAEARVQAAISQASRQAGAAGQQTPAPVQAQPAHPPPPDLPPSEAEVVSHAWMEGTRVGEATNPGPSRRSRSRSRPPPHNHQQHPSGSCAPGRSSNQAQAPARQRRARAVPQAPAGERTKRIDLGPNPSDDHAGNRPGGSGRGEQNNTTMTTNNTSRAGTAQRNQQQRPQRGPDNEWKTVHNSQWRGLQNKIARMADALQSLTEQLAALQPPPPAAPANGRAGRRGSGGLRDDNPWAPMRDAAKRQQTSIGIEPPSRNPRPRRGRQAGRQAGRSASPRPAGQRAHDQQGGKVCASCGHDPADNLLEGSVKQGTPGKAPSQRRGRPRSGRGPAPIPEAPSSLPRRTGADEVERTRKQCRPPQQQRHASNPPPPLPLPSTPRGIRQAHAGNSGHPTTGGSSFISIVSPVSATRDNRPLLLPLHGKRARSVQRSSGRQAWDMATWRAWLARGVMRRDWRKTPIRRMLELRRLEAVARGDPTNYHDPASVHTHQGSIYAAFHFPTGKWYIGQTINTIQNRAQEHWHARRRASDYFHLTLADDPDPMCLMVFPVECIPRSEWAEAEPRRSGWRSRERTRFRAVATPRERYWVDKLRSMWPKGWNSQYPGKPAAPGHPSEKHSTQQQEPARDIHSALGAIQRWASDPTSTLAWLRSAARQDLVEILEGLEKGLRPKDKTPSTAAIATEVRAILRQRKLDKQPRDFVRFLYGNRMAASLQLPELFRDPSIYSLHPEPQTAAAIMVVHRFAPQIASDLFNYNAWSSRPSPLEAGDPAKCPCHAQVLPDTTLHEGHVLSTDVSMLASSYLREILAKGKKYRLQQPLASVLPRLKEGLDDYISYKVRLKRGDANYQAALERWAAMVLSVAQVRISEAAREERPEPDGYPGLKQQLQAAKAALVFGPEDRAPHAVFFACGRYYASKLHQRLEDGGAFQVDNRPTSEVLEAIKGFNDELDTQHEDRLPYLYGAWKAKKEAFRWIAGTSRMQDASEQKQAAQEGAPNNALTAAATMMVGVCQHILKSLRAKDILARSRGEPPRYWVIEDIDEFVAEFRAHASALSSVPWATYDFTTMYEALEHSELLAGCMQAVHEAWDHERRCEATRSGKREEETEVFLNQSGWATEETVRSCPNILWLNEARVQDILKFMLDNLFVLNAGVLRRQVRGVPMGLNCAGQLANLYGYAKESAWVDRVKPKNVLTRRFIDDIFVAGPKALQPGEGLPSEDDYVMKYKLTSDSPDNLIYIGVRLFKDEQGQAHSMLHDRAVEYPIQVDRYPEHSTVANPAQLGGVIMGRLVAAQRTCSRLDLFQDAVAGVFTHAYKRGYSRRLLHSVWTRFLSRYWDAASVSTRELRAWFHTAWQQIVASDAGSPRAERSKQSVTTALSGNPPSRAPGTRPTFAPGGGLPGHQHAHR